MIRQGKISDSNQIVNIKIDSWNDTYKGLMPNAILENMNYEKEHSKYIKNFNNRKIKVYEDKGEILGYAYYGSKNDDEKADMKECTSEIYALYVKKKSRRLGIGTKLISSIFDELKKENNEKVLLWCVKGNEKAINFYQKNDFKYLCNKTQDYNGSKLEEICFEKKL